MGGYPTQPDRIRLIDGESSANRVQGDKHK
jgi:hypothetical protein